MFPLPLALVVLEEIWIALGVVEEARGGDVFFAEGFGKRNGLAGDGFKGRARVQGSRRREPLRNRV